MRLTIYSKPGCHLCDVMKEVIHRVIGNRPGALALEEVDITTDAGLMERYGTEIPVLMLDGAKVAKYRITEEELRKMLRAREKR